MKSRSQGPLRPIGAEARALGLYSPITRRDFIGSTLVGSGAMLLGASAQAFAQGLTSEWNGYTGVGDYSRSNGNIASVVNAAHGVRDGIYEARIASAPEVDEVYDLIIVGGGFAGRDLRDECALRRDGGGVADWRAGAGEAF